MLTWRPLTQPVRPKKSFGQHFLTDSSCRRRIVRFAEIGPRDDVLEIGAGSGLLTQELLARARSVTALEFDRDMLEILTRRWPDRAGGRLKIVSANMLRIPWDELPGPHLKLVGNLPYNIAARTIRQMIEKKHRFHSFTLMVQKEVAQRLLAAAGSADYGAFSALIQRYFEARAGFDVSPGSFSPRPRVLSHVMKLLPRPSAESPSLQAYERLLRIAFRHRRKTLWNNLKSETDSPQRLTAALSRCGALADQRPQELEPAQFECLARMLYFGRSFYESSC